jgi:hypothetical protein
MKSGFQQRGIIARGTVRTVWLEREVESPATSCHSAPDEDTCNLKTKKEIENLYSPVRGHSNNKWHKGLGVVRDSVTKLHMGEGDGQLKCHKTKLKMPCILMLPRFALLGQFRL